MAVVEKEEDRLGECWGRPRYPGKQAGVNVATQEECVNMGPACSYYNLV